MMLLDPSSRIPLESMPVFPLPNTVFFPEQQLPLHIFEPRYRAMIRDALERAPYLVVSRITGGASDEKPSFASIATAGKIVAHQRLPDGRFNVLLEGSVRVSIEEIESSETYRRVRCTALIDPTDPVETVASSDIMAMMSLVGMISQAAGTRPATAEVASPGALEPARVAFRIADRLIPDGALRQRILDAVTVRERITRTTEALAQVLSGLTVPNARSLH